MSRVSTKVIYLYVDDWARLYVGGKLIAEGHSIDQHDWLQALEVFSDSVVGIDLDEIVHNDKTGTYEEMFTEDLMDLLFKENS